MTLLLDPFILWRDRRSELEQELNRVQILLNKFQDADTSGRFGLLLSPLLQEVKSLSDDGQLCAWRQLALLQKKCRAVFAMQLELLGGAAGGLKGFDAGFISQAEEWLNQLRREVGLDRSLVVIAGRGPVLDIETGVVRCSFLDWDYWRLPLLGRALGLLATTVDSDYRRRLDAVAEPWAQQVAKLLDEPAQAPIDLPLLLNEAATVWKSYRSAEETIRQNQRARLEELANRQRAYIHHLFADMFATAILGPAYALAVFVLELDYLAPTQYALEDPDQIEERDAAPRFLPASAHRAAAILTTLQLLDEEVERPAWQSEGPYTAVMQKLESLWQSAIASVGWADPLAEFRRQYDAWHQALYKHAIQPLLGAYLASARERWRGAEAWWKALAGKEKRPEPGTPALPLLVGAVWLHRLDYPEEADRLLKNIAALQESDYLYPLKGSSYSSLAKVIVQIRLDSLQRGWERWRSILTSEIPREDRVAVQGRFFRLLSEQEYHLELCSLGLQGDSVRPGVWSKLADLQDKARLLRREALEFLGGWLVHAQGFDREWSDSDDGSKNPSLCELTDALLREYAWRAGVNWSARAIPGKNPFLATDTEVIRVRFPDWSLWNLPVIAHEFGHLAALATPEFLNYRSEQQTVEEDFPQRKNSDERFMRFRRQQMDELFADIFATYTLGPAFVCDAILLQLEPTEAYRWRGSHPTHAERVEVILQTLATMNERTRQGAYDEGCYAALLETFRPAWRQTLQICEVVPADEAVYQNWLKQSQRWGRGIYRIIDKHYRRGVSYKPERWRCAQTLAARLMTPPIPERAELQSIMTQEGQDELLLVDLLNALWWARVDKAHSAQDLSFLTSVANEIACGYLGSCR